VFLTKYEVGIKNSLEWWQPRTRDAIPLVETTPQKGHRIGTWDPKPQRIPTTRPHVHLSDFIADRWIYDPQLEFNPMNCSITNLISHDQVGSDGHHSLIAERYL
jgi:hypothetical protein